MEKNMITIVLTALVVLALLVALFVFRKRISEKVTALRAHKQANSQSEDYAVLQNLAMQLRTAPTWTHVMQAFAAIFPPPLLDNGGANPNYSYFWDSHLSGWDAAHPPKKRKEKSRKEKPRQEETSSDDIAA
jgi:hypothetical protein